MLEETTLSWAPRPGHTVGLNTAPSGPPSPLSASFSEPSRRLLHPCQLINRLSGQVSDIDHLIRTLSDQSLAHLMGLLPCAYTPTLLFCAREQVVQEASLCLSHPRTRSPLANSKKVRASLGITISCPGAAKSGNQSAISRSAPALLTLPLAPQPCGGPSWSSV